MVAEKLQPLEARVERLVSAVGNVPAQKEREAIPFLVDFLRR